MMQSNAGTVAADCGCRSCLRNRAWLRRVEREVVADLRRQSARTISVGMHGKRLRQAAATAGKPIGVDTSKAYFEDE
jgi:hypothetical protein